METKITSMTATEARHVEYRLLNSAHPAISLLKTISALVNRLRAFMQSMYDEAGRL